MILPDKSIAMEEAISKIGNGATVMLSGFGVPGTPFTLIRELVRQGPTNLTIVKNDANEMHMGVDHLLAAGQVRRLITTHIGLNARAMELMNREEIEVEFCAQGILAERIRAGGAGLQGFVTDVGMETELANGKPGITLNGKPAIIETALRTDFALVHAARADLFGNLQFAATARNFTPLMVMAADHVIVETEELLPLGGIEANAVHAPGVFIDHVVGLEKIGSEYNVVRR